MSRENPDTKILPVFVFDIGGVVIKWRNSGQIYRYIAQRYRLPIHPLTGALAPEVRRLESGDGDADECVERVLAGFGRRLIVGDSGGLLLAQPFKEKARLRKGVVQIITKLRREGYRVYALSNTCLPHLKVMRENGWPHLFDGFFTSCELGAVKPHRDAYLAVLGAVGAEPSQTVFVDDREENVIGAKLAGIRWPIHYTSIERLKQDIERILEVTTHGE